MAKNYFGAKFLTTVLATFALASCQSESTLLEPTSDNLRDVELTVIASKGDLTRTNLTLSEDEKKLLITWNKGEKIQVSEADGTYAGYLTVTELIDGGKQAKFQGTIRTIKTDGTRTFTFVALGKDVEYSALRGKPMDPISYDFSKQTNSGVGALAQHDLLIADSEVEIKGGEASFNNIFMRRQFAYGRFQLLYNDEPLKFDENTVITVSKSDMKNGASLEFPKTVTAQGESSFTVATTENDFYVTLVPGTEMSALKFTLTINGDEYEGYSNEYLIAKNTFYRKANGLEVAQPLPINVRKTDGSDDEHSFSLTYNANYGANDKWVDNMNGVGNTYTYTIKDYNSIFAETNTGYDFIGWNTKADGTGETLIADATLTVNYTEGATVYAQWTKSNIDYKVILKNEDGSVKEELGTPSTEPTQSVELPEAPEKDDYDFVGWKEEGTEGPATKGPWELTEEKPQVTLVPVYEQKKFKWQFKWVDDPEVGDVSYGAKNETGTDPHTLLSGFPTDLSSSKWYNNMVKDGYTFKGWKYNGEMVEKYGNTYKTDKIIATRANAEKFDLDGVETYRVYIYAQWEKIPDPNTITTPGYNPGTFNK